MVVMVGLTIIEGNKRMWTKTRNRISLAIISAVLLLCTAFGIEFLKQNVKAKAETPSTSTTNLTVTIESNNLSYADSIHIIYAVSNEGFDRTEHPIQLLFWEEPQTEYVKATAKDVVDSQGSVDLNGNDCLVFYSRGLAAREMTLNIYARPCVEIDGLTYYGELQKFSILEYVYAKREDGGLEEAQTNMFDAMLQYGAAAQILLEEDTAGRLATATYYAIECVNGAISDGTSFGRYTRGEKVVLNADAAPTGKRFLHWTDELGTVVGRTAEMEITVADNKTYTAVYENLPTYTVKFIVDGEVYHTISTTGGEVLEMPADPEKEKCVFDGWFVDEGVYSQAFTADSLKNEFLTEDISVYAKFSDDSRDNSAVTFTFGENGAASHEDGVKIDDNGSYTYTVDDYTLTLTNAENVFISARDAKGNSCLKLGTSKGVASFDFTVPDEIVRVVFKVAKYRTNASKISVNRVTYILTKNSDDGEYEEITVDTSTIKTISFRTMSGACRCMIDSIVFHKGTQQINASKRKIGVEKRTASDLANTDAVKAREKRSVRGYSVPQRFIYRKWYGLRLIFPLRQGYGILYI